MYRQIAIHPDDQKYQKILWREEINQPLCEYQLTTVTYGTTSAPYLATKCLQQIANLIESENETIAHIIKNDFSVDDLVTGASDVVQAKQTKHHLQNILDSYGFKLNKWNSNHDLDEQTNRIKPIKVLGLNWDPSTDKLKIQTLNQLSTVITKRHILSDISKIFDPLGLISPVVVQAKILMQLLWLEPTDWDKELSTGTSNQKTIADKFIDLQKDLKNLSQIEIPRYIHFSNNTTELHLFVDASQTAYAAVIYSRTIINETVYTSLVTLKSRVAPTKTLSLPRLELSAAFLGAMLLQRVQTILNVPTSSIFAWSDSEIVLAWLQKHPSHWKTFVANRTAAILDILPRNRWNHVPSNQNPADIASRGCSIESLQLNRLWWNGPEWLKFKLNENLKLDPIDHFPKEALHEEKKTTIRTLAITSQSDIDFIRRFSNYSRLVRTIAYCVQFYEKLRKKTFAKYHKPITRSSALQPSHLVTADEIHNAELKLIKLIQGHFFQEEIETLKSKKSLSSHHPLKNLCPLLDDENILRVGGRLQKSNLPFETKHQIIIPKSYFSELLIRYYHRKNLHAPVNSTIAAIRQKFWILNIKQQVKKQLRECVICCKIIKNPINQLMGQLPASRITPDRPFSIVGVDYAGPIETKTSNLRRSITTKTYICLFICFLTKAVHLEIASDLSGEAFLAALKRFISRRGKPTKIYSDNGRNFVAVSNILDTETQNFAANERIQWVFNPPSAPHMGGIWETHIKSAKRILKIILGETKLTFEELYTVITQIEAQLNSRPLTPISDDTDDLEALTPGHFLIGCPLNALPDPIINETSNPTFKSRWHHLQHIVHSFWQRWQKEYLSSLQPRYKWKKSTENIKKGDLVILRNHLTAKNTLGRIIETYPGEDGWVRVVKVKTEMGQYKRPVSKCIKLPIV